MTDSLAIVALTTTGIDWITPESWLYLYRSFCMSNPSLVNQNSPSSLALTAYILWLQQTRTAESDILHPILPIGPLTLLQTPKTTENYQKSGVFSTGIPHSEIHIYPLSATNWVWTNIPSNVATHKTPNSILRPNPERFFNSLTILCHAVTSHMLELEA